MSAMRTPASGKAQAARAISAPAAGVARATGSRVKKAMLALRSLAQSVSQPSGVVVMDRPRPVPLSPRPRGFARYRLAFPAAKDPIGDGEFYLVFCVAHCLSRPAGRASGGECRGRPTRIKLDQAAEEPRPARGSGRLAGPLA